MPGAGNKTIFEKIVSGFLNAQSMTEELIVEVDTTIERWTTEDEEGVSMDSLVTAAAEADSSATVPELGMKAGVAMAWAEMAVSFKTWLVTPLAESGRTPLNLIRNNVRVAG